VQAAEPGTRCAGFRDDPCLPPGGKGPAGSSGGAPPAGRVVRLGTGSSTAGTTAGMREKR
jgi:hypothetical protein